MPAVINNDNKGRKNSKLILNQISLSLALACSLFLGREEACASSTLTLLFLVPSLIVADLRGRRGNREQHTDEENAPPTILALPVPGEAKVLVVVGAREK
jgi:hypothetical protein